MPLIDPQFKMPHTICVLVGASVGLLLWTSIILFWVTPIGSDFTSNQIMIYSVFGAIHGALTGLSISVLGFRLLKAAIATFLLFQLYVVVIAIADPVILIYWPIILVASLIPNLLQGFLTWTISNLISTREFRIW